jgi:hypothetical protein
MGRRRSANGTRRSINYKRYKKVYAFQDDNTVIKELYKEFLKRETKTSDVLLSDYFNSDTDKPLIRRENNDRHNNDSDTTSATD